VTDLIQLGLANLLSPMVLCFALGAAAALMKSDLEVPEPVARGLALYLMFSIGFKGGASLLGHGSGAGLDIVAALLIAVMLSFGMPFIAFALLRALCGLERMAAGAVAAHYGSVSIVTFVAATQFVTGMGLAHEGYVVAMLAAMETPAIVSGLLLARSGGQAGTARGPLFNSTLLREIMLNASIVILVGAFLIGVVTGTKGAAQIKPFTTDIFNGALCLFLLDMGLVAGRQLRSAKALSGRILAFGLCMPLIGAGLGLMAAWLLGLSLGGAALLSVLCASASYIAAPAAMRLALPQVPPALYVTLSLVITFPFNVVIGIPVYFAAARALGFAAMP
jgi:uncharacterized protein